MKKLSILVGLLLSFVQGAEAQADGSVQYYAKIAGVISPLLEFMPTLKISQREAETASHYRVRRDAEDRLSSIKFFKGTTPSSDSYFYTHEVRYSYQGNRRIREYFGTDGQPMAMRRHYYRTNTIQKEVYLLNGNITTLHLFGLDGDRVEAGTGTYVFEGEHQADGSIIQRLYKKDGGHSIIFPYLPFETAVLVLDENGFIHQILNYDEATKALATHPLAGFAEMRIEFDEYGNELGWSFRDETGQLVNRSNAIEDGGYAVWKYELDWIDQRLGHFRSFTQTYFTADGKVFCKPSGICTETFYFDDARNFLGVENRDRTGALIPESQTQN